jgi:hypothetical protein
LVVVAGLIDLLKPRVADLGEGQPRCSLQRVLEHLVREIMEAALPTTAAAAAEVPVAPVQPRPVTMEQQGVPDFNIL